MKLVYHYHPYQTKNMPSRLKRRELPRPYTLLIEGIPSRADITALAQRMAAGEAAQALALGFGWGICHWRDEFSRAKGLEEAGRKLLKELVYVDAVSFNQDASIGFTFMLYGHEHTITLGKSGRPNIAPGKDGLGTDRLLFALATAADERDDAGEVQP